MTTWLFGYGSLVSPESLASTIGRPVDRDRDMHVATLSGWGRRWNYGSEVLRGGWTIDGDTVVGGLVVSLGVERADESMNGVVFGVNDVELADLDWRERAYDRVDVTAQISYDDGVGPGSGTAIGLYVPRPEAVARYEQHRDAGTAAIRASYHALVEEAFAALGDDHLARYRRTPPPDVPIAEIRLDPLPSTRPSQR